MKISILKIAAMNCVEIGVFGIKNKFCHNCDEFVI